MTQAMHECGFVVDNTPLMIEAVPTSADSMILIITKVDDPDELDSRFSRFSPEDGNNSSPVKSADMIAGADDILDLIQRLTNGRKDTADKQKQDSPATASGRPADHIGQTDRKEGAGSQPAKEGQDDVYLLTRFYLFHDLQALIRAAHAVDPTFSGESRVYKNPDDGNYFLILRKADASAALFNRTCNIVSEYGLQADYTAGMEEYFTEHLKVVIPDRAVEKLRDL